MRGLLPTHRLATRQRAGCPDNASTTHCAQCRGGMGSSPSGYWCSEGCMKSWLQTSPRRPDAVVGSDAGAATHRMARRYAYLVATTGNWRDAWRSYRA
ncbi:MAG: hypothetical protein ACRDRV_11785 [Pseudonocardiaceae bacterium]